MGSKPSNNFQSNRPESGGANRKEEFEKSGLLDRDKREFAESQKAEEESPPRDSGEQKGERASEPNPESREE